MTLARLSHQENSNHPYRRALKNTTVIHKFRNQNKEIKFTIGLDIYDHFANGLHFYSKNRLINIFMFCEKQDIVGVMEIPYMTLEKSENNEGFVNK